MVTLFKKEDVENGYSPLRVNKYSFLSYTITIVEQGRNGIIACEIKQRIEMTEKEMTDNKK